MHNVTLIPGDWIGPEVCEAVQKVISATGVKIKWDVQQITDGEITDRLLNSCRQNGVVLKGKVDSGINVGKLPPTIELRKKLGLWASVRPVRPLPEINAKFPDMDVVVIRETSEDIYSGFEHEVTDGVFEAVKVTTPKACERIIRYAFDYAVANGRKEVTVAHKSNIMKKSDGLFLKIAKEVSEEYPQIKMRETIVDALCMQLVRWADSFDVLVTLNLFGDIIGDLCSGLAGGITASPAASYGDDVAIFENLHGRVPEWVGKDLANPIPMLNSAVMMLQHLDEIEAALQIKTAIAVVVSKGIRTTDMYGTAKTSEITNEIILELNKSSVSL
jgi:isocitrate dehydrogenase (NAD+)